MFALATIASAFTVFPGEAWVPMLTSKTDRIWVYAEENSLQHGNLESTINLGFYHRDFVGETFERHLTRFLCHDKQVHIIATGEFKDTTFNSLN